MLDFNDNMFVSCLWLVYRYYHL